MDSTHLTAVRTGLCSALATDVLARREARSVAVIGVGMQGEHQLRSLHMVRQIGLVRVYDTASDRAVAFADRMRQSLGLKIEVSDSVAAAVEAADMVLAATWARTPFILPGMLQPGTHVSTIGPDEPGKCEVSAEVIRDTLFVCDDRELAVSMGAIGGAQLGADASSAELGEVIGGSHPGRTNTEQITIYGGVGLAFQGRRRGLADLPSGPVARPRAPNRFPLVAATPAKCPPGKYANLPSLVQGEADFVKCRPAKA